MLDIVIRGGMVYDGLGNPPVAADVGVRDGRIEAISSVLDGPAALEIDARGLAVCPGFIDVHTHDDIGVLVQPDVPFKALQGVTTDIVGNCGFGPAPYEASVALFEAVAPAPDLRPWEGFAGYMARLEDSPPAINVGVLAGHGSIRKAVMGSRQGVPDQAELTRMQALLDEALEAGVLGLSTGLIYDPGRYAAEAEIQALAAATARSGGIYASHMRNEGGGLLDSIAETLRVAEATGISTQVSHHKASGRSNWGLVARSLGMLEAALDSGLDIAADQYPYTAGSTVLEAVLAAGALERDDGPLGSLGPADVLIAAAPAHPEYEGQTLDVLARAAGREPVTFARQLLEESGLGVVVVVELMAEDDVVSVLRHPTTMVGSDGIPAGAKPHPRLWGTFPRVLGRYARDRAVLDLATAIHKMTGQPARKFRLFDRGRLEPGAAADIVVFDPSTVRDTATYADPTSPPVGIRHVLVNGEIVVDDSRQTSARPGRVLRRH